MNITQAIILGIIQGLTEFFPVSSSGHLAIFQNYIGEVNVGFDVILHLATLLAVLVFFFFDILDLIKGFFSFNWKDERFRICVYIIIATIPSGLAGWFLRDYLYGFFSNLYIISLGFFISGMFLFTASFSKPRKDLKFGNSFIVGLSQAISLVPGISRSGSTISTGILLGIEREKAIKFSFLLAIPAMIGANLINFTDIKVVEAIPFIFGFIFAFIFGLLAIFVFIRFLKLKRFRGLAYYCWLMALVSLIFSL